MAILKAARILSILAVVSGALQHSHARAVETRSEDISLSHGATTHYHDQAYKLHQVADGLFAGVKEEEWDDNLHVRNVDAAPYVEARSVALPEGHLFERDFNSQCRTGLRCATAFFSSAADTLHSLGMMFVDQLTRHDSQVMRLLNQPFYANFAGVGGQNFVVTGIFTLIENGSGGGDSAPEDCSNNRSQEDLLRALIAMGCANNPERAAFTQEVVFPDGSKFHLNMAAAPGRSLNDSNVCGAPRP